MNAPIILTIPGPPRTKKTSNRVFKVGKFLKIMPSAAWTEWRDEVRAWWAKAKPEHFATIEVPVNCQATFYRDARRGDAVGYYQGLADVLQAIGVVADDKYITSWDGSRLRLDRENPRVEVLLSIVEKVSAQEAA